MMLSKYIILKAFINDKYLSLTKDGKILFDQNDIKKSDALKLRYEGKYVILKTKFGHLSVNSTGNLEFINTEITDNERFEIEYIDENWFVLKANNRCYISVQNDGKINANQKNFNNNEKLLMSVTQTESIFEFLDFLRK